MNDMHRIGAALLLIAGFSNISAATSPTGQTASMPVKNDVAAPPLTLEQALAGAEKTSTTLLQSSLALEAARRQLRNNWNTWIPSFSLSGSVVNNQNTTGNDTSTWTWSASGGINLTLKASMPIQMRQAAEAYEAAETAYRQTLTALRSDISSRFYSLLAEKENIVLQKENLEQAETQLIRVQTKYNSGLSSELDLLNARYTVASLKPEIQHLESEYTYNVQSFCAATGIDGTILPELIGTINVIRLELPASSQLTAQYCANRLDVRAAETALAAAKSSASVTTINALAPSVMLKEEFTCRDTNGTVTPGGTFTAAVTIPINGYIPGTADSLTIKKSKDAVESALQMLEQIRKEAAIDIAKKTASVTQSYDTINAVSLNVQIATRSWELARDGYNNGLIDQKDFDDYRIKKATAQQTLIQKQIDYITAVSDLAVALNITPQELYAAFTPEETKK